MPKSIWLCAASMVFGAMMATGCAAQADDVEGVAEDAVEAVSEVEAAETTAPALAERVIEKDRLAADVRLKARLSPLARGLPNSGSKPFARLCKGCGDAPAP